MSVIGVIARILGFVIAQPGARDFMSEVGRRAAKQAATRIVSAINKRSQTRKSIQTMR